MSIIETLNDQNNSFLSRREIVCDFKGLGGKLKKLEAVDMITKEFKLDGKFVIPIKLQNHTGRSKMTGIFYVYDDENLAKKHVNPTIFARLDRAKTAGSEKKADDASTKPEKSDAANDKADLGKKADDASTKPEKSDAANDKADLGKKDTGKSN